MPYWVEERIGWKIVGFGKDFHLEGSQAVWGRKIAEWDKKTAEWDKKMAVWDKKTAVSDMRKLG